MPSFKNLREQITAKLHVRSLHPWPAAISHPLVGVADVKHAARISLNTHGIVHDVSEDVRSWIRIPVVEARDPADVILRFRKVRNSRAAGHGAWAGIVSGQAQLDVAPVALQKLLQVTNPGVYVLLRVK